MAGGKGTRLRPYTYVLPKPLVPIGEFPILEYILRQLAKAYITNVTIVTGYKADILQTIIGDGTRFGLSISYLKEETPLGTMGSLSMLPDLADDFLVMNGDLCTDMDFDKLLKAHGTTGKILTVSVCQRIHKLDFGVLEIDRNNGEVLSFQEKPEMAAWVAMGIYALNKKAATYIPKETFFGFDTLMHTLISSNIPIGTYCFNGRWHDIGQPEDYFLVQDEFEQHGLDIFGLSSTDVA